MLEGVTHAHIESINRVVAPIDDGDILTTCGYYHQLVNTPDFPESYDKAHGVVGGVRDLKQFRGGEIHERLKAVTNTLGEFQRVAFVIKLYGKSWELDDMLERAANLWRRLSSNIGPESEPETQKLKGDVNKGFNSVFDALGWGAAPKETGFSLETADDVVALVRKLCRDWQRHAQQALYGRHGLNRAISKVRILAPPLEKN